MESKATGPSLAPLYKLTEAQHKTSAQKTGAASSVAQVLEMKRGNKLESVSVTTPSATAEKISYLMNLNSAISTHNLRSSTESSVTSESEVNEILSDLGKALGEARTSGATDPVGIHNLDVERALDLLKD